MIKIKTPGVVCVLFAVLVLANNSFGKQYGFVDWKSPIPRFTELGLDVAQVADVAGEGLFTLILHEKKIDIWSRGEIKTFDDARITIAAAVINAPVEKIKSKVLDIKSMEDYMPQISGSSVTARQDTDNFMAQWTQTYKVPLLELKAKFLIQHRVESTGDISGLLHKGDIDSGAFRWEFIPVTDSKTLVVYSYWGDQRSAGLAFKIIMKAQPELVLSMGTITSTMILSQLKKEMEEGDSGSAVDNSQLPLRPKIPVFKEGGVPVDTLVKLSGLGRLILVEEATWVQGEDDPKRLRFTSGIAVVPLPPEKVIPLASDYPRMPEYVPYFKKLTIEPQGREEFVDIKIKVNIGPVFIRVNNKLLTKWNEAGDVQTFYAHEDSDLRPFYGALEYLPLENGSKTLSIYTLAVDVSDDAGWLLKLGKQLPEYDLIMNLHQAITLLDKQDPWLLKEVNSVKQQ